MAGPLSVAQHKVWPRKDIQDTNFSHGLCEMVGRREGVSRAVVSDGCRFSSFKQHTLIVLGSIGQKVHMSLPGLKSRC